MLKVPFGSLEARRVDGLVKYCGEINGEQVALGPWEFTWTGVACRKCGDELGDVPATLPRADLCEKCFVAFADHAAEITPGQLVGERLRGEW
jgi:hypothetical protein